MFLCLTKPVSFPFFPFSVETRHKLTKCKESLNMKFLHLLWLAEISSCSGCFTFCWRQMLCELQHKLCKFAKYCRWNIYIFSGYSSQIVGWLQTATCYQKESEKTILHWMEKYGSPTLKLFLFIFWKRYLFMGEITNRVAWLNAWNPSGTRHMCLQRRFCLREDSTKFRQKKSFWCKSDSCDNDLSNLDWVKEYLHLLAYPKPLVCNVFSCQSVVVLRKYTSQKCYSKFLMLSLISSHLQKKHKPTTEC